MKLVCMKVVGHLVASSFLFMHTPALAQSSSQAVATVSVVSPAEASAEQATQLLFGSTASVLKITIPGGSSTMDLTATGVDATTGSITFESSSASAELLGQLLAAISSGALSSSAGLTVSGLINGQGVQLVILDVTPGEDGSGSLKAVITFD
jgi:hypothetical protein